ncbi:porin [Sphingomonas sp. BE270]|jgi:porin|uniref:carbohydrate porin n=1 Tax=Sphingomonas sp. BE270 TaxID=2817726 RepID=UPI00285F8B87|nr:carbohydrate porin [Sphingomonas sp. BE270]MDR7260049.1 porin [Sphingomonas sp. BE270]
MFLPVDNPPVIVEKRLAPPATPSASNEQSRADGASDQAATGPPPAPPPRPPVQPGVAGSTSASPHILGDWKGLRSRLIENGFTPSITYVGELSRNLNGGKARTPRYADQWAFGVTADAPNIFGGPKAKVQVTLTYRNGQAISTENALGVLQLPSEIYGRGEIWRLTQAWYRASFGNYDLKVGRVTVGEDFASAGCEFQTLYFCGATPGQIAPDYWHNYPVSQWGVRLRYNWRPSVFLQLGAYEVNADNTDPTKGFNLSLGGAKGVMMPVELDWTPTLSAGLAGSYRVGIWHATSNEPDIVLNTQGQPRALAGGAPMIRHGLSGIYANARQALRKPGPDGAGGVTLFFNAAWVDDRTTKLESKIGGGVLITGPFPGRPGDEVGLAIGRVAVNKRLTRVQQLQNLRAPGAATVQTAEVVTELYYGFQPISGLIVRPNVQYIRNPSGVADRADMVLIGVKVVGSF